VICGDLMQPCCAGGQCSPGRICNTGTKKCEGCGGTGETCCPNPPFCTQPNALCDFTTNRCR
jgi:hypothetical protein